MAPEADPKQPAHAHTQGPSTHTGLATLSEPSLNGHKETEGIEPSGHKATGQAANKDGTASVPVGPVVAVAAAEANVSKTKTEIETEKSQTA